MLEAIVQKKLIRSIIEDLTRVAGVNMMLTSASGAVIQVFPSILPDQGVDSGKPASVDSRKLGSESHNCGKPIPLPANYREVAIPIHNQSEHVGFLVVHVPATGKPEQNSENTRLLRLTAQVIEYFLSTSEEISDLKLRLHQAMETDLLTGLGNQRACRKALEDQIGLANKSLEPFTVSVFSLDHMSILNDTHGIKAGDSYILAAVALLKRSIRHSDHVFRELGTRFVIVMPNTTEDQADLLVTNLKEQLEGISLEDIPNWRFLVNVGTATWKFGMASVDDILESVDIALFRYRRQQSRQKRIRTNN